MTGWLLIGAGGHAKALVEGLIASGHRVAAYVDSRPADWLTEVERFACDAEAMTFDGRVAMGLGGQTPDQLATRLELLERYMANGAEAPAVAHPSAVVSPSALLGTGAVVLAGAIVQPAATVSPGVIVNTGAIVEHDAVIGPGSHVGPGAVVLGGAFVGSCAMVGSRAVVLPRARVEDLTVVKAGSLWRASDP